MAILICFNWFMLHLATISFVPAMPFICLSTIIYESNGECQLASVGSTLN